MDGARMDECGWRMDGGWMGVEDGWWMEDGWIVDGG